MRHLIKFLIFFLYINCRNTDGYAFRNIELIDTSIHFYSVINIAQFDTLTDTEFTWAIYKPINDTISFIRFRDRESFIQRLNKGQKALYYIWELERSVLQGNEGFANFYYNYQSDFAETVNGVKLIDDTAMVNVLNVVNKIFLSHQMEISKDYFQVGKTKFASCDRAYVDKREHMMKLLESYIRNHVDEFIRFN